MRVRELFERSDVTQGGFLPQEVIASYISDSTQLTLQLSILTKTVMVFQYDEFGPTDRFIILADRVKRDKDIVGYLWLKKVKPDIWQAMDVHIFQPYQRQGLGLDLYVKLIRDGYKLINGYSLSTEAEKLWRKLPKFVTVQTWNKKTGEVTEYSEKPKADNSLADAEHEYFWLATSNSTVKESAENSGPEHSHWFELWLAGSQRIPGTFRTAKYGTAGEDF